MILYQICVKFANMMFDGVFKPLLLQPGNFTFKAYQWHHFYFCVYKSFKSYASNANKPVQVEICVST